MKIVHVLAILCIWAVVLFNANTTFSQGKSKESDELSNLKPASSEVIQLINKKISSLLIHDPGGGVLLYINKMYDLSNETAIEISSGTNPEDIIGLAYGFGKRWGTWDQERKEEDWSKEFVKVSFRMGLVVTSKAIPAYVRSGTQIRIRRYSPRSDSFNEEQYIFYHNNWYLGCSNYYVDPPKSREDIYCLSDYDRLADTNISF